MAQIQVLDLKLAPRLEPVEEERNEQVKQTKHYDGGCADSPSSCQARVDEFSGGTAEGGSIGESGQALERAFPRFTDDLAWWVDAAKAQRQHKPPPY
jgi:hypothetical protein